jgi:TIR domain
MTVAGSGGIFVSYRRQESSHLAGRLADRLADRFGEGQVFIDVNTIEPGVDFAEEIFRAVAACKVLLAIIGPAWLTATDERGDRRLDDPDDIVRLEIEAALARGVRVIPILVESAVMPGRQDLPESLAPLVRRNALHIRHDSFRDDSGRLVTAIERILAPAPDIAAVPIAPDAHGVPSDLMARWVAAMQRFDVPPGQGLTRQEASAAFRENGLDPRSSGSWARHGWITREGDRRYITAKGKEWLAEHDAV